MTTPDTIVAVQDGHENDIAADIYLTSAQFNLSDEVDSGEVGKYAARLQQRCSHILQEINEFQDFLKLSKRENSIETRTFKSAIQAELKMLDKVGKADPSSPKVLHSLRSSNLVFYSAVWSVAKSCTGVAALTRRLYKDASINNSLPRHKSHTVVDIIAQNGLEWVKVSSITEKRIIWDLAKAGWVGSESDEDEDEDEAKSLHEDDSDGLLKQAEVLLKASRTSRVNYKFPTVKLILPRIKSNPASTEVATILQKIRDMGVIVQTSEEYQRREIPIAEVLSKMATERCEPLSETLNVDCTILLAFVSDISHGSVAVQDWHNKNISRQMEREKEDRLMEKTLWPICASRKLVCTKQAATTMMQLVTLIGTETEKKRAALIFNVEICPKKNLSLNFRNFQHIRYLRNGTCLFRMLTKICLLLCHRAQKNHKKSAKYLLQSTSPSFYMAGYMD